VVIAAARGAVAAAFGHLDQRAVGEDLEAGAGEVADLADHHRHHVDGGSAVNGGTT